MTEIFVFQNEGDCNEYYDEIRRSAEYSKDTFDKELLALQQKRDLALEDNGSIYPSGKNLTVRCKESNSSPCQ